MSGVEFRFEGAMLGGFSFQDTRCRGGRPCMVPTFHRHHGRDRSSFAGAMAFSSLWHDVGIVSPFFCNRIDCDWVVAVVCCVHRFCCLFRFSVPRSFRSFVAR